MDSKESGGYRWGERIRYRVDLLLSQGSATTIGSVVVLAVVLTFLGGLAFWVIGVDFERQGPVEAFWQSFLRVIGRAGIEDSSWVDRLASFTLVLAGIFLTGSLITLLVAAVSTRLDALRRGRGRVLEQGHTVILGWSPRLMPVIDELLSCDDGTGRVSVVVLADRDKQVMEDDFRAKCDKEHRRRVLFRRGEPSKPSDLKLVAVDRAHAVIVLSDGSFVDAIAVQRALAALHVHPKDCNVVVEMTNPVVARSLTSSTAGDVVAVTVNTVVADMLAQAIRAKGMARLFDDLLSFEGSELYILQPGESAVGRTFGEVTCGADNYVVLGILTADDALRMVPPLDTVVNPGDQLVVLAERSATALPEIERLADPIECPPAEAAPLSVVMIGWSKVGKLTLDRLADYLPPGSRVKILADESLSADGPPPWTRSLDRSFVHTKHDPEQILEAIAGARADVVAVVGYSDGMSEVEADALSLLTIFMLHKSDNRARIPDGTRIVAHLFDSGLHDLAVGKADFVLTDALASRMLVHASRHKRLGDVYADLFEPDGSIVDVIPAPPIPTKYGAVAAGIVARGMVPIGTIVAGKVHLNPSRSDDFRFRHGDSIVVVRRVADESSTPVAR
jgi:Trk K+ transport system NAD-binding subunit